MLQGMNVSRFISDTSDSLNIHASLYTAIMDSKWEDSFNNEFSYDVNPRMVHLIDSLSDYLDSYNASNKSSNSYDANWSLIPTIASMLIHRGSQTKDGIILQSLPNHSSLLETLTEFGSHYERRELIMDAVQAFIDVASDGHTAMERHPTKVIRDFSNSMTSLGDSGELGKFLSYSGIILYTMTLTGEGGHVKSEEVNNASSLNQTKEHKNSPIHSFETETDETQLQAQVSADPLA